MFILCFVKDFLLKFRVWILNIFDIEIFEVNSEEEFLYRKVYCRGYLIFFVVVIMRFFYFFIKFVMSEG